METVKSLQERRANLLTKMRELVDSIEKEDRDFTPEESEKYSNIEKDYDALDARIERQITLEERSGADVEINEKVEVETAEKRAITGEVETVKHYSATSEYRNAFYKKIAGATLSNAEVRALTLGTDTEGGHTVPETFVAKLIEKIQHFTPWLEAAEVFQVSGTKSLEFPKESTEMDDAAAGTETGAATEEASLDFGNLVLTPAYYDLLVKVSNTLLRESAIDLENWLTKRMAQKFAQKFEKDLMTGNGTSNKAVGVFNTSHADAISTARDVTFAGATAITGDDVIDLYMSLPAAVRTQGTFLMHRVVRKALKKLKDSNGQYIYQPGFNGERPTIEDRPILESEFAPNSIAASQYTMLFGDPKEYYIMLRHPITIQKLTELFAVTKQTGLLGTLEATGKPANELYFSRGKQAAS